LEHEQEDGQLLMSEEMARDKNTKQTASNGAELTLAEARAELRGKKGREYWSDLGAVAARPGFDRMLEREFPQHASEFIDPVSRRGFMKLMGASMALAGLAGCTKQPDEPIYPYVKQPEDLVLGKPLYFATAFPFPTGALPLLVKSDSYRPIKVDGNPDHPMSKGGSDPISQGTLLGLYDPDRSPRVLHRGEQSHFEYFQAEFVTAMQAKRGAGGQGLYILSGTVTSPTLAAQWKKAQEVYPQAKWIQYDPVNRDSARIASKAVFGDFYDAQYMLTDADVILSLDADFLSGIIQPGFTKLAADWAARRRMLEPGTESGKKMNRLYVVESSATTTGFKADHRLALKASDIPSFAAAVAAGTGSGSASGTLSPAAQKFLDAVVKELKASGGRCVVIPGEQAHASVHAAAMQINEALGNVGKTVVYTETVNPLPTIQGDDIKSLVADMNAGKVDWLIVLEANPVYTAPADLNFADALNKVGKFVHLGLYVDETGKTADWHINAAHYLESWSDARAYDGSITIIQPLIAPLYGGKTAHDVIQSMLDNPAASNFDVVRGNWFQGGASSPGLDSPASTPDSVAMAGALTGDGDENFRRALHNGLIPSTAFQPKTVKAGASNITPTPSQPGAIEVIFRPDPSVYDGRYANIGWLQELPKPVTNIAWDNAALMSHATATKQNLAEGDVILIEANGFKVKMPVFIVPGHADDSITLYLGHGRTDAGRVGLGIGVDAYALRTSYAPLYIPAVKITKTSESYDVCSTKSHYTETRGANATHGLAMADAGVGHNSLEGNEALTRGIVRYATLEEFQKSPGFAHEGVWPEDPDPTTTMFSNYRYDKNAWGLAIDQNSCVGCNACVVSCYAENNIAVVGRHQVKTGRDMQWLRIDTYFEGDLEAPRAHFQPMMCQHCENAPCEQVCPVGATVHTPEGLNTMVYNRCVGTRYCSNNCPYKVRRFNFLLFSDYETESLKLMRNPDVTVRSRGVMEKCTYCVQRIMAAKIEADKQNREVRDGEIITACQQACPTSAITFGNINDPNSKVRKIKDQERNYGVIADLNTRPRTTYIAEVLNPNSELEA
jgi:molybdopterin-containing oxidoreductase family iron-sulfur binding subunit